MRASYGIAPAARLRSSGPDPAYGVPRPDPYASPAVRDSGSVPPGDMAGAPWATGLTSLYAVRRRARHGRCRPALSGSRAGGRRAGQARRRGIWQTPLMGTTTTTIKVDATVRDRLTMLARERGTTLDALLAEAAEALERQAFFARAQAQLERLKDDDPAAWEADRAESRSWQLGIDRARFGDDDIGWGW